MRTHSRKLLGLSLVLVVVGATSAGIDVYTSRTMVTLHERGNAQNVEITRLLGRVDTMEQQLAEARENSTEFVTLMLAELTEVRGHIDALRSQADGER